MQNQLGKLMEQAQRMQSEMQAKQEELDAKTFEGSAGGGMATATVNGRMEVLSVKFMPEAVDPQDVEMLEDVVLAAIKDAQRKALEEKETQMSSLTGGMKIPGLF